MAIVHNTVEIQVGGCVVTGRGGRGATQNTVRLACPCGKIVPTRRAARVSVWQRFRLALRRAGTGNYQLLASNAY